jgi:hypothetical protein
METIIIQTDWNVVGPIILIVLLGIGTLINAYSGEKK